MRKLMRERTGWLIAGCLMGLSMWQVCVGAGTGQESFAIHHALILEGDGPWYQFDLLASHRLASQRSDQMDIRVFDAKGKAMPFSLLRPQIEYQVSEQRQEVALFPLYSENSSDDDPVPMVRLETNARGTLIEVIPGHGENRPETAMRRGWLLDTSALEGDIVRLLLDWTAADDRASFQRFAIEGSDDLRNWRGVGSGQVVRMTFKGERIDQREVLVPGVESRYLRLIWRQPRQAPELLRVSVTTNRTQSHAPLLSWSTPLSASRNREGGYRLELPHAIPIDRMRIDLPQINTLAPLEVSGGYVDRKGRELWSPLGEALVYRLSIDGHEAEQNEIPLSPRAFSLFRLQTNGSGGGLDMPQLRVKLGLKPMQLVFLARGEAPYHLAVGNRAAVSADLPIETLMPPIEGRKPVAGIARLGERMTVPSPVEEIADSNRRPAWNWKQFLLWGVLFVGVTLLVTMTTHILRSSK